MSKAPSAGKWADGLFGDTPGVVAARRVLQRRLRPVRALLPLAAGPRGRTEPEHAHQLRVATRRAGAALILFREYSRPALVRRVRRLLREIRAAASAARRDDVHLRIVCELASGAPEVWKPVEAALAESRERAQRNLEAAADEAAQRRLRRACRRLLAGAQPPAPDAAEPPYTLAQLAGRTLPALLEAVCGEHADRPKSLEDLHALRIAGKKLRYALELTVGCFPASLREQQYARLVDFQDRLGAINDWCELAARLELGGDLFAPGEERKSAAQQARAALDSAQRAFTAWWRQDASRAFLDELQQMVTLYCSTGERSAFARAALGRGIVVSAKADGNGHNAESSPGGAGQHWRVAAIDIGTNSVRMVVAESDPLSKFRVIQDVRETTRLGSGLYRTGTLDRFAVERTLGMLERMRSIADGYRVDRLRAVGTSALREAGDREQFLTLARERARLNVEVIDADYEARLAFASVVEAFDLERARFATIDLGGGSTEVVISTGELIDSIHKLQLGAVRLTEQFGVPDGSGEYRFTEMRRAIDATIAEGLSPTPNGLDLIVGTGGTFTSIAKILIRRGDQLHGEGRFPFNLRGFEVSHSDLVQLLDWLRRLPLEKRKRVPGLSEKRAEIIVAGLCVVERLMEHLGVDRLWVHDGGIRDGLLTEMIDELGVTVARTADRARTALAEVRAFAQRVRYDVSHSEHVSRLALSIFDQLAAQIPDATGAWGRRSVRDLLQAAAILHDVGILIEYRRHHRHSQQMILQADLPSLTRREIAIISCVARYHRRRPPRSDDTHYDQLSGDDQRLVCELAGILRIADGLDRLHDQSVLEVRVQVQPNEVGFELLSPEPAEPNRKLAAAKSDLFARTFRTAPRFDWSRAAADARRPQGARA